MSVGLLLIDIQNDYFIGGKMELQGSSEAARMAGRLLAFFRQHQWPITHIQHLSVRPGATFFIPETPGADIYPGVKPLPGEMVIQKHYPNSFRETILLAHLQQWGIQRLVVAGMMTHMCVDATVRAAADYGYDCRIIQDACATRSLELGNYRVSASDVHTAFLAALNGTYGRVMTADAVLAELQKELQ
ncbi:MAG TPA: cysteine hydrolase family protein [Anaerolineae bacterium]|nr:cysteine hydrolase family protein [Anaerolineae bacterium]